MFVHQICHLVKIIYIRSYTFKKSTLDHVKLIISCCNIISTSGQNTFKKSTLDHVKLIISCYNINSTSGQYTFKKSTSGHVKLILSCSSPTKKSLQHSYVHMLFSVCTSSLSRIPASTVKQSLQDSCIQILCYFLYSPAVTSTVKQALQDSCVQILSPKRRIDILRDAMDNKKNRRPYTVTFCGVNGVGKSTNLAKVFSAPIPR